MGNNSQACISSSFNDIRNCNTYDNRSKISSKGLMNMKLSVGKDRHFSRQTRTNNGQKIIYVDLGNSTFKHFLVGD